MKLVVIFGSKSDAYLYEPLKSRLLSDGHDVDFLLMSCHRSPEALDKELRKLQVDAVIAGAGLAAHLPGITAAKVPFPVFAVPCTPALGGLDALLAMIQMPFGVPVLTAAPDKSSEITNFIAEWSNSNVRYFEEPFHLVVEKNKADVPYIQYMIKRAATITDKVETAFPVVHAPTDNSVNICLVELDIENPVAPKPFPEPKDGSHDLRIYVPVLNPDAYKNPLAATALLAKMQAHGGLWVGLNMVTNGVLAALQLANFDGQYNPLLTNSKKGYIHA